MLSPASAAFTMAKKILIVDDEESILYLLQQMLRKQNYIILSANSYEKAKMLVKEYDGLIDLLITDIYLSNNFNGIGLHNEIETYYPLIKTLYISGDINALDNFKEIHSEDLLIKPFDVEKFNKKIQELLK
jgi:DNA-binding NtrC family response regulator